MSISSISFRSTLPNQENFVSQNKWNNPKLPEIKKTGNFGRDIFEFADNKLDTNTYKRYSCKGADMLKYDLEYSKPSFFNRDYEITGDAIALSVKNKFSGGQNISGVGYGENVDINIKSGLFSTRKGDVTGKLNGKELNIKYQANENAKSINISGNIEELDEKNKDLLIALISDKIQYDLRIEQEMEMAAIAGTIGR